jgi:mono/diheme cytochrome c family protein
MMKRAWCGRVWRCARWPRRRAAQNVEPGRQVFASRCANCHGTGGGGGELGPSILGRIPLRNDAELEAVIREGVSGAGMPAFPNLSKAEAGDLVAFLRTLKPRAGAGPQRTTVALAKRPLVPGVVLNQSDGEMQCSATTARCTCCAKPRAASTAR